MLFEPFKYECTRTAKKQVEKKVYSNRETININDMKFENSETHNNRHMAKSDNDIEGFR